MMFRQGNGQVDGQRGDARAAARRVHRGHIAACCTRFFGRSFSSQASVGLRLTFGGDRSEITQHPLVLAEQGVEVSPSQATDGDVLDGDRGGRVQRFSHERRFADDLSLTKEVQHALLADAFADKDPHPT